MELNSIVSVKGAKESLNKFIESELDRLEVINLDESARSSEMIKLNTLFHSILDEGKLLLRRMKRMPTIEKSP